jgi:alpha-galactosidase/6-phospho-beta-glucosidase family protein
MMLPTYMPWFEYPGRTGARWQAQKPVTAVSRAVNKHSGIHPEKLPPIPEALLAFCRTQASIQKLVVEAYGQRSRNLLLQALLVDPIVNSVENAEKMLDHMLELQRDYLPAFT